MNTLSLRLPESLHRHLQAWAEKDQISVNQFIATAVAEKIAALSTVELLEARGQRSSPSKFAAALASVPDVEPDAVDQIPRKSNPRTVKKSSSKRRSR